jgi:hypothetical protein
MFTPQYLTSCPFSGVLIAQVVGIRIIHPNTIKPYKGYSARNFLSNSFICKIIVHSGIGQMF